MQIREWLISDCEPIALLEKKCFSDPWSLDMIVSAKMQSNFFGLVLSDGDSIKGYIGVNFLFEDGEILLVAVDESCRGLGYGKKLVLTVCDTIKAKGVERCLLEVRKSNKNAISCYLSCGFNPIGERKHYYQNGEDAIIMEKTL